MSISWNWSDPALFNLLQTQNVVLSQILSTNHCQQQTTRNWVSVILPKNIPKNNILDAPNRDSSEYRICYFPEFEWVPNPPVA